MRLKLARASNLPPFVIFHDRTLRAITQELPQTTSELLAIRGCGDYKVSTYGNQTIEVVRAYLKRHLEAKPLSKSWNNHDGSAAIGSVPKPLWKKRRRDHVDALEEENEDGSTSSRFKQ